MIRYLLVITLALLSASAFAYRTTTPTAWPSQWSVTAAASNLCGGNLTAASFVLRYNGDARLALLSTTQTRFAGGSTTFFSFQNGTSSWQFFVSQYESLRCQRYSTVVPNPLPANWLSGAAFLGQRVIDGVRYNVWTGSTYSGWWSSVLAQCGGCTGERSNYEYYEIAANNQPYRLRTYCSQSKHELIDFVMIWNNAPQPAETLSVGNAYQSCN